MIRQVSHFLQECPVCGRPLKIASEYEGCRVCCDHCGGTLVASNLVFGRSVSGRCGSLSQRADRSLAREALPGAPKVLMAECRDEVFARVATDLAQAGLRVVRAVSVPQALALYAGHRPVLVIVSRDLSMQDGWSLVGQLHRTDPDVRVWVYQPSRSAVDVTRARLFSVDALVDYGGDLLALSDAILNCLAGCATSSRWSFMGRPSAAGMDAA